MPGTNVALILVLANAAAKSPQRTTTRHASNAVRTVPSLPGDGGQQTCSVMRKRRPQARLDVPARLRVKLRGITVCACVQHSDVSSSTIHTQQHPNTPGDGSHQGPGTPTSGHHPWSPVTPGNTYSPVMPLAQWQSWGSNPNASVTSSAPGSPLRAGSSASSSAHVYQGRPSSGSHVALYSGGSGGPGEAALAQLPARPHTIAEESSSFGHSARDSAVGPRPPWPLEALEVPERPPSAMSTVSRTSTKFKPAPETAAEDAATQLDARALAQESAAAIAAAMAAAGPPLPVAAVDGTAAAVNCARGGFADVAGWQQSSMWSGEDPHARRYSAPHSAPPRVRGQYRTTRAEDGPPAERELAAPRPGDGDDVDRERLGHASHAAQQLHREEEWETMACNPALAMIMEAHAQSMRASPAASAPRSPFSLNQRLPQDSHKFSRQPGAPSTTDDSGAEPSDTGSSMQPPRGSASVTGATGHTNTATLALPAASTAIGIGSQGSGKRYSSVTLPQYGAGLGPASGGSGGGSCRSTAMPVFGLPRRMSSSAGTGAIGTSAAAVDSLAGEAPSPRNSGAVGAMSDAGPLTHSLSLAGAYSHLQAQSVAQSAGHSSSQHAERRGDAGGSSAFGHGSMLGPPNSLAKSIASVHTVGTWDDLGPGGHRKITMLGGLPLTANDGEKEDEEEPGEAPRRRGPASDSSLSAVSSPDVGAQRRLSPRFPSVQLADDMRAQGDTHQKKKWQALVSGAVEGEVPQKKFRKEETGERVGQAPGGVDVGAPADSDDQGSDGPLPREVGSLSDSGFGDDDRGEERSGSLQWPPRVPGANSMEGVNAWIISAERAFQLSGSSMRSGGSSRSWSRSSGLRAARQQPRGRFRGMHVADTSRDLEGIVERMHGNAPLAPPRHVIAADSVSVDGGGGWEGFETTRSVSDTGRLSGDSTAKVLVGPWGGVAGGDSSVMEPPELAGGWNTGAGGAGEDNGEVSISLYRGGAAGGDVRSPARSAQSRSPQPRSPAWPAQRSPGSPLDGRAERHRGTQWSAPLQSVPEGHGAEGLLSSDDGGTLSGVRTPTHGPLSPQPSTSPKSPVPPLPPLPPPPDAGDGQPADAVESMLTARKLMAAHAPTAAKGGDVEAIPGSPRPQVTLDSPQAVQLQRPYPLMPLPSPHPHNAPQSRPPRVSQAQPAPPQSQLHPLQPQSQPPRLPQAPPRAPAEGAIAPRTPAPSPALLTLGGSSASDNESCEALADRIIEIATASPPQLLFGRIRLVEDVEPRLSRQGVVAFAERRLRDEERAALILSSAPAGPNRGWHGAPPIPRTPRKWQDAAVKFFLDEDAFQRCRAVAQDVALRSNGAMALLDILPRTAELPPAVVVAKGVNMETWSRRQAERQRSDSGNFATGGLLRPPTRKALEALAEVASAMHAMHACGWICGAIKPSNVAWCPDLGAWAVVDFGYSARIGAILRRRRPRCITARACLSCIASSTHRAAACSTRSIPHSCCSDLMHPSRVAA